MSAEAGGPDPPIVRGCGGDILKRMDDVRDGITVSPENMALFQGVRTAKFQGASTMPLC